MKFHGVKKAKPIAVYKSNYLWGNNKAAQLISSAKKLRVVCQEVSNSRNRSTYINISTLFICRVSNRIQPSKPAYFT